MQKCLNVHNVWVKQICCKCMEFCITNLHFSNLYVLHIDTESLRKHICLCSILTSKILQQFMIHTSYPYPTCLYSWLNEVRKQLLFWSSDVIHCIVHKKCFYAKLTDYHTSTSSLHDSENI